MGRIGDVFAVVYHLFLKCLAELHAVKTVSVEPHRAQRGEATAWAARPRSVRAITTSR